MALEDITAQALCGIMERALVAEGVSPEIARELAMRACQPAVRTGTQAVVRTTKKAVSKGRKKVSKYQREFGRQLKALKKKHPRTPVTRLMKRAHSATRKVMK